MRQSLSDVVRVFLVEAEWESFWTAVVIDQAVLGVRG